MATLAGISVKVPPAEPVAVTPLSPRADGIDHTLYLTEFIDVPGTPVNEIRHAEVRQSQVFRLLVERLNAASEGDEPVSVFPERRIALQRRDLRLLDHNYASSTKAGMLLRRNCLLITLPPVRALLLPRSCIVFKDSAVPSHELQLMLTQLNTLPERNGMQDAFAECALRVVFRAAEVALWDRWTDLSQALDAQLIVTSKPLHRDVYFEKVQQHERTAQRLVADLESTLRTIEGLRSAFGERDTMDGDDAVPGRSHTRGMSITSLTSTKWMAESLDDFDMHVENMLAEARLGLHRVQQELDRMKMLLAKDRNNILRYTLMIQLTALVLGANSVVSGWMGMNLDNGICGPDGCHARLDISSLNSGSPADHGHGMFLTTVLLTTFVTILLGTVIWWRLARLT